MAKQTQISFRQVRSLQRVQVGEKVLYNGRIWDVDSVSKAELTLGLDNDSKGRTTTYPSLRVLREMVAFLITDRPAIDIVGQKKPKKGKAKQPQQYIDERPLLTGMAWDREMSKLGHDVSAHLGEVEPCGRCSVILAEDRRVEAEFLAECDATCEHCGDDYSTDIRDGSEYCSDECYDEAVEKRKTASYKVRHTMTQVDTGSVGEWTYLRRTIKEGDLQTETGILGGVYDWNEYGWNSGEMVYGWELTLPEKATVNDIAEALKFYEGVEGQKLTPDTPVAQPVMVRVRSYFGQQEIEVKYGSGTHGSLFQRMPKEFTEQQAPVDYCEVCKQPTDRHKCGCSSFGEDTFTEEQLTAGISGRQYRVQREKDGLVVRRDDGKYFGTFCLDSEDAQRHADEMTNGKDVRLYLDMHPKPILGKKKPVCVDCGNDNVLFDAYVSWNPDTAAYEVDNIFDGVFCSECDTDEAAIRWVPVEEETAAEAASEEPW